MVRIFNENLTVGQLSKTIQIPNNTIVSSILVKDQATNQQVLTDITINNNNVIISLKEEYNNVLNIIITGIEVSS